MSERHFIKSELRFIMEITREKEKIIIGWRESKEKVKIDDNLTIKIALHFT